MNILKQKRHKRDEEESREGGVSVRGEMLKGMFTR